MKDDHTVPCPFCKGVNSAECLRCKGRGTFKIAMAPAESIDYLRTFADEIMEAISDIAGIEGVWISDMSCVSDFISEDAELAALSEALNVPVAYNDTIVEVAKRLRDA